MFCDFQYGKYLVSRKTIAVFLIAFVLAGAGLLWVVQASADSARVECERQCHAVGKRAIAAPTGTAGRSVDGGSNRTEHSSKCICLP